MISTRTTDCDKGGKDDPIELEKMVVEDRSSANATDSHLDHQMDVDPESESEVEEIDMKETEMTGPNKDPAEISDVDMQNQEPGVDKAPAKLKETDEIISEIESDDEVEEMELQGESPKSKKIKRDRDGSTKSNLTIKIGGNEGKSAQNLYTNGILRNNAWKGNKTMKEAVLAEKKIEPKGKYTFRIRAVVETKQSDNLDLTLFSEKQRILNLIEPMVKKFDSKALVLDWNRTSNTDKAVFNIGKLSPYSVEKYIGLPNNRRSLGTGKNKVGLRINSNLTLHQFIDAWGKYRKEKGWVFVTQAEMQSSPTAFAVGVCQGSSPNMVTTLINKKLAKTLGAKEVNEEVSWQHVTREDMRAMTINEMWKKAKNKADEETPSGVQKNRILNLYAPSGLLVYVSSLSEKNQ